MIFDAVISSEQSGPLVLRERPSTESAVFRPLFGLFLLGVGCPIICVFLSGGGPTPVGSLGARIFGWAIVAVFFVALGLLPLGWGLSSLFVRRSYTLRANDDVLESQITFAGAPVWTRRRGFAVFERVAVRYQRFGVFGMRSYFIVACDGQRRVDLSAFTDRAPAESFAADIGTQMRLSVVVRC
ncbi:MAG: hypothetical protein ABI651_09235 [Verrucomicrobiota bacterium]